MVHNTVVKLCMASVAYICSRISQAHSGLSGSKCASKQRLPLGSYHCKMHLKIGHGHVNLWI